MLKKKKKVIYPETSTFVEYGYKELCRCPFAAVLYYCVCVCVCGRGGGAYCLY